MNSLTLKTFYFHETFTDDNINKYNASNGIIISRYIFENIPSGIDKVSIIKLYKDNKKIYVNIIDTHDTEDNIAYVPLWIYEYLNYTEDCKVDYMVVYPKIGNKIKIKPRDNFYAFLDDPITALRNGFEEYTCLVKDTVIIININGIPLDVEILETYINNEICNNHPIYIRGVELEVDIQSIEKLKEKEEIDFDSMLPPVTNIISKFPGKGHKLI
jgi:hypothetical protein